MDKYIEKANILLEALPYIKYFFGKTIVIKYGGNAMTDDKLKESFAKDITLLKFIGINPVIVHGGGPQIGKVLNKMGLESKFYRGMRITNDETMDVVEMVLMGKVNKEIVNLINQAGGKAVGLSGKDGKMIVAEKITYKEEKKGLPPEIIDLGNVGKIVFFEKEIIKLLDQSDFIPVIAPIGVGENGETYNINADLVASEIAIGLNAEKLVLLTDIDGVKNSDGSRLNSISASESEELIENGIISGGMIPKIEWAIKAVKNGVKKAHILDGRVIHSVLLEIFTDKGIGTEIIL